MASSVQYYSVNALHVTYPAHYKNGSLEIISNPHYHIKVLEFDTSFQKAKGYSCSKKPMPSHQPPKSQTPPREREEQ
jgi:hypothetical protein